MKQRSIETHDQLAKAVSDISRLADHMPFVITISPGKKIRTEIQNSRYWCMMQESLDIISAEVDEMAERTGYTPLEARRVVAAEMPWEQSMILACRKSEAAHEVAKMILGIPTSTRLGTKDFMKFEDQIDMLMAEIVATIRSICKGAG